MYYLLPKIYVFAIYLLYLNIHYALVDKIVSSCDSSPYSSV